MSEDALRAVVAAEEQRLGVSGDAGRLAATLGDWPYLGLPRGTLDDVVAGLRAEARWAVLTAEVAAALAPLEGRWAALLAELRAAPGLPMRLDGRRAVLSTGRRVRADEQALVMALAYAARLPDYVAAWWAGVAADDAAAVRAQAAAQAEVVRTTLATLRAAADAPT